MVSVLSACVFFSPFPTIHMRGSTASSQSLLRSKRLTVVSRITNKCLLESVTVTPLLKQFPSRNNADGHISGPRSSLLTGLSVCTFTQCARQHIKSSGKLCLGDLATLKAVACSRPDAYGHGISPVPSVEPNSSSM